jgi:hypothetical protein
MAMALDYLPIQATSVPSESIFSRSAATDTPMRSKLSGPTMEALQMAKSFIHEERLLNFTSGLTTQEADMLQELDDVDPLQEIATEKDNVQRDEILAICETYCEAMEQREPQFS